MPVSVFEVISLLLLMYNRWRYARHAGLFEHCKPWQPTPTRDVRDAERRPVTDGELLARRLFCRRFSRSDQGVNWRWHSRQRGRLVAGRPATA